MVFCDQDRRPSLADDPIRSRPDEKFSQDISFMPAGHDQRDILFNGSLDNFRNQDLTISFMPFLSMVFSPRAAPGQGADGHDDPAHEPGLHGRGKLKAEEDAHRIPGIIASQGVIGVPTQVMHRKTMVLP